MAVIQPNIILILTDHFRRDAIGSNTPNLVSLASSGTRFVNAYSSSPLCQPSRTSIITGLYPWQTGICGNQSDPISNELRDDTFMNHLQNAGYYTAMIGKHHYIDRYGLGVDVKKDNEEIKRYGFNYVCQVVDDGENIHNEDEYTKYLEQKGLLNEFRSKYKAYSEKYKHPFKKEDTVDGFIEGKAYDFIKNYSKNIPFYLNVSFVGPHPPYWHPGELKNDPEKMSPPIGVEDSYKTREIRAHYMDKCSYIDSYIGKLLAVLEERDIRKNTIIIFTSDHGDCLGDFGIWDKRYFYEQVVGVPLIISGPGIPAEERFNGAKLSKALISNIDLYPTIMNLSGAGINGSKEKPGYNILEMLKEKRGAFRREVFADLATSVMIRTGNWKLVFDPQQGGVQYLFNLVIDPREKNNLAGVAGYESITLELIQRILSYRILKTQFTHIKEEQRLQRVHIGE